MIDSDSTSPAADQRPLIIVLTEPEREVAAAWYDGLARQTRCRIVVVGEGWAPDDLERLDTGRGAWWQWLGTLDPAHARDGLIILSAGLVLPDALDARLGDLLRGTAAPALATLPGSHDPTLDPAAGDDESPPEWVDSILQAASPRRWTLIHHRPERVALIAPGRLDQALTMVEQRRCALHDSLYLHDPLADDDAARAGRDQDAALGPMREALVRATADAMPAALPLFGYDERPVVLHISHDWGGGIARWIGDLIASDRRNSHLVLSAGGPTDGRVHGQWLTLYAGGPGQVPVRQWTLAPAIGATDVGHEHYAEILAGVVDRYGVARVIVSSLIGHSLDALKTDRPTLCMLHDYYPAWPVLNEDPLAWLDDADAIDFERALSEAGDDYLFEERNVAPWRALAGAWLEAVRAGDVTLAAPGEHVLARWRRLLDDPLAEARILPHGFTGWPEDGPRVEPAGLADGRLNLVVVGRLTRGKGRALLEAALPGLRKHARLTLLGCGAEGMRFFGEPDVDVVLDYEHEALPRHLARIGAQAVLFLSTVAETWNYVLTETRALGLVPLAARTGSFVERIDDGTDGLLFEPEADVLVDTVAGLRARPEQLEALRANLPDEPGLEGVLANIENWVPARAAAPRAPEAATPADIQGGSATARSVERARAERLLAHTVETLRDDLEQRTDWARKQERLADERTQWARSLEREATELKQAVADVQAAAERDLELARADVEAQRARVEALDSELQAIFASRSWRITRPMRVLNRIAANARRRRVYNPLRWPRLLARLIHNLRIYGARGTLVQMQQGVSTEQPVTATVTAETVDESRPTRPVAFDPVEAPEASIVIPVYDKVHYTSACLNSLAEIGSRTRAEVIVVDDCSTDDTADYLSRCEGLRVLRNARNSGFIASCNAGAEAARGRVLVFLNNDTTVTEGWLDALIDTFDDFPEAGIVGGRLVYPDGRLQEAGGIVFRDGSGWNYGRGDRPDRPAYSFASETDYVSGACLAIERERFQGLGGFDSHYAPAYYEDTDLCFRVREEGLQVICQPACTIVHHEGVSSGTDENSGTKRYQAVNREKFLARWREVLQNHPEPVPGPEAIDAVYAARHRDCRGHVLVIDATTPEPDKDSGSMRLVALLTILRQLGYRVSFVPENLAWIPRYTANLQALGIEVLHHPWIDSVESGLRQHGQRLDLVIVSRHYVLSPVLDEIRRHCPEARLVFDTVDLHFLREQRMAELGEDEKAVRTALKTREQELALIERSDATLVVSPVEQHLLRDLAPDARIEVLSNIHRTHGSRRAFGERRDLLFVGGFQHPPNLDAAEWLIDDIMPRVRERLGDVRLHLIGSRMPESLRERRGEGVVVHGYVEDLTPYLEGCRLSVAPLRYGAGVKGKVNQAMAWGLPVVASACAAEGMYLEHGRDVLVAETSDTFADAVVRAYTDEALWNTLSAGGLANVEAHFSFDAARRSITDLVKALGISA